MAEAFLYDAIRTPRGKGKDSGGLYTVHPVLLLAQTLNRLKEQLSLDTTLVDDVVMGCVTQVHDQGACLARTAVLMSDYDIDVYPPSIGSVDLACRLSARRPAWWPVAFS